LIAAHSPQPIHQLPQRHTQHLGDPAQIEDRQVAEAGLNLANEGTVELATFG
jgi:hypothetical protein